MPCIYSYELNGDCLAGPIVYKAMIKSKESENKIHYNKIWLFQLKYKLENALIILMSDLYFGPTRLK